MGFFDLFRGRRRRESALPEGISVAEGQMQTGQQPEQLTALTQQFGPFGGAIARAMLGGNVEVTQMAPQVMNLQGQAEDLREAILKTLASNGIDAEKGQQVQVTDPDLQQQIFRTLAEHGVDVGAVAGAAAADPAVPMGGGEDTVSQLERLQRLRESGTLTDAEFEQQKRRILGG